MVLFRGEDLRSQKEVPAVVASLILQNRELIMKVHRREVPLTVSPALLVPQGVIPSLAVGILQVGVGVEQVSQ